MVLVMLSLVLWCEVCGAGLGSPWFAMDRYMAMYPRWSLSRGTTPEHGAQVSSHRYHRPLMSATSSVLFAM